MNWTIAYIIHILSFIIPNFLLNCVMNMAALSIFWTWVWVEMGVGMFLLDLSVKTFLPWTVHILGAGLHLAGCCIAFWKRSEFIKCWNSRVEKLEVNDTQKLCLYHDFMDENISMMNKYSELYWVTVRSLVCRAQTAECQFYLLDNALLYKISYTLSLLQIIYLLIPSNSWYYRWNTQFISHIRRHTISAHLLYSLCFFILYLVNNLLCCHNIGRGVRIVFCCTQ
jgi:hypothetical protein